MPPESGAFFQLFSFVQLFQHFYSGVSSVSVDINIVLPGDAAEGDDLFRADAAAQIPKRQGHWTNICRDGIDKNRKEMYSVLYQTAYR